MKTFRVHPQQRYRDQRQRPDRRQRLQRPGPRTRLPAHTRLTCELRTSTARGRRHGCDIEPGHSLVRESREGGSPPLEGPGRFRGVGGRGVSGMDDCAEIGTELGVYILGAISPARRAAVARHLASCQQCREEVAGLAALPGLLRRLPAAIADEPPSRVGRPADAEQIGVLRGDMITRISRRRRRNRWVVIAAAIAGLAAAAVAGLAAAGVGWA